MTREQALAKIEELGEAMHAAFEDEHRTHGGRLDQLDSVAATLSMVVGHLYDEEARETDHARRILAEEADPPSHRPKGWAKAVAGRAR